jgi:hypothetical protein
VAGGVKRYSGQDGSKGPSARAASRRYQAPANDNARRRHRLSLPPPAMGAALVGLVALLAAALIWAL